MLEKNELENVKFKKLVEYTVTGLSINQDNVSSLVVVTDSDRQNVLSNIMQKLVKEIKEPNFDLEIYNTETSEVITPFQKKPPNNIAPIKLTFYNTTTKKLENVEFYNYIQHLEKYGFVWEHLALEFKYSVEFSIDKYSVEFSKDKNNKKNDHGKNH